jgi:hypothetical protein
MKLMKTVLNRKECLEQYNGYTEMMGERFDLKEPGFDAPRLGGNHILFAYEYDKHGAETGYTKDIVKQIVNESIDKPFKYTPTYGGYVNPEGTIIEENGYLLTFYYSISPVTLGALAHKIADLFRQESVLAIYESEVTFVYS